MQGSFEVGGFREGAEVKSKVRLQFDFSPEQVARIDKARERLEAGSRAEAELDYLVGLQSRFS